jgi:hypothetical protein
LLRITTLQLKKCPVQWMVTLKRNKQDRRLDPVDK